MGLFPTACPPAPLSPQHASAGSASPSNPPAWHHAEPRQASAGARLGHVHGKGMQSQDRTGCKCSTSHPRDCSPQEGQDRSTWHPPAHPSASTHHVSPMSGHQARCWAHCLPPAQALCPATPLAHRSPQPVLCSLNHPIPNFDLDQESLSPSCTKRPVATSSLCCPELSRGE